MATVERLLESLGEAGLAEQRGRLAAVTGTALCARGLHARIGDLCEIDRRGDAPLLAEVVGFADGRATLAPLGEVRGLLPDAEVRLASSGNRVRFGPHMLGRILDVRLRPIDGRGPLGPAPERPLRGTPPDAMARARVDAPFASGVRAIDGLMTIGIGQRMGIFAAAGTGKSTLLAMIAAGAEADAVVIALIGERGREVREFVEDVLGAEGLARAVVIVATADRPAAERVRAAEAATAVAEGLRDGDGTGGGRHVLLMMDSVTRYARALREMGLAAGEPPVRRGFPPSVFAELPRLMERAGPAACGAITGLYTVLLEEEDGDPIGEEVRSLLDGHIHLAAALAARGRYPAIDVGRSLSRLFPRLADAGQQDAARQLRAMLAKLDELELLIQLGEYRPGSDPLADRALAVRDDIEAFLSQPVSEHVGLAETVARLRGLAAHG